MTPAPARTFTRGRRGITVVLGIVLLGLVAVAVALVTKQLGYELQRTRSAYEDAQLRQLLLAGAQAALDHAPRDAGAPDRWTLDLPPDLVAQDAAVSLESEADGPNSGTVRIDARLGRRAATETLEFSVTGQKWKFVAVRPAPGI